MFRAQFSLFMHPYPSPLAPKVAPEAQMLKMMKNTEISSFLEIKNRDSRNLSSKVTLVRLYRSATTPLTTPDPPHTSPTVQPSYLDYHGLCRSKDPSYFDLKLTIILKYTTFKIRQNKNYERKIENHPFGRASPGTGSGDPWESCGPRRTP